MIGSKVNPLVWGLKMQPRWKQAFVCNMECLQCRLYRILVWPL